MHYYFAPMEGVTGAVYRRTHHEFFSGVDKYFMPFITPTTNEKLTPRQKRDVLPEYNEGVPAVPQLLTRSAADCIWAVNALHDLGYPEVNLNLGCPSGTVTAKGKGAGFLAHPDELDRFFDEVFAKCEGISVKTRLGVHEASEFDKLLEIYNRYPITELTIHPRVRQDFYKGKVRESDFDRFDLIIGMDSANIEDLRSLAPTPEAMAKIKPMAHWLRTIATRYDYIPDPYYEGAEGFELVLDLLQDACANLYSDLTGR